jgi:hypothetical protein
MELGEPNRAADGEKGNGYGSCNGETSENRQDSAQTTG